MCTCAHGGKRQTGETGQSGQWLMLRPLAAPTAKRSVVLVLPVHVQHPIIPVPCHLSGAANDANASQSRKWGISCTPRQVSHALFTLPQPEYSYLPNTFESISPFREAFLLREASSSTTQYTASPPSTSLFTLILHRHCRLPSLILSRHLLFFSDISLFSVGSPSTRWLHNVPHADSVKILSQG